MKFCGYLIVAGLVTWLLLQLLAFCHKGSIFETIQSLKVQISIVKSDIESLGTNNSITTNTLVSEHTQFLTPKLIK